MRRFAILAVLLACGIAYGQQSMLFSPSGQQLPAGKYRLLVIPADATQPPVSTVLDVGGTIPPVVPPVVPPVTPPVTPPVNPPVEPPIDDMAAQMAKLIAGVTTDPDKAVTAKGISTGLTAAVGFVESGQITKADSLRTLAKMGLDIGLRQTGKTAAWKPFTDGLETLAAPMDLITLTACYRTTAAQLAAVNDPPTNPPVEPPTTKATAAVYIYEKDQSSIPRPVAAALQAINADASLGITASEFEQNSTTGLNQVSAQYRVALERARKEGLPCLVVMGGGAVLRVVDDPKTESEVMEAIK